MHQKYFEGIAFPKHEYERRYQKLQSLMSWDGLDLVILTDDRFTWYYTGFGGVDRMGARCRPRILLVPAKGPPLFLVHQSTAFCAREMLTQGEVRTYASLESMPVNEMLACVAELSASQGLIGMELGRETRIELDFSSVLAFQQALPGCQFRDAAPLLWEQRMIKTPLEIQRIRRACQITSQAYREGFAKLRPGMTEVEIGSVLEQTMVELGAQGTWSWVIAADYERIDGLKRHMPVESGALIFVDMGANVGGYWSDFSRSAVMGKPKHDYDNLQSIINDICAQGLRACQPGVSAASVGKRVDEMMQKEGLPFSSGAQRYGHGIGLAVTEPPNLWPSDDLLLQENMVLAMEPGTFNAKGMFHLEENFVVTSQGPELLSSAQREITYL